MTRKLRLTLSVEYEVERGETVDEAAEKDLRQFQEEPGAAIDFLLHHYNNDCEIGIKIERVT